MADFFVADFSTFIYLIKFHHFIYYKVILDFLKKILTQKLEVPKLVNI